MVFLAVGCIILLVVVSKLIITDVVKSFEELEK